MSTSSHESGAVSQSVSGHFSQVVQVAGSNTGTISIVKRPKVPSFEVPKQKREAAREPLWVHTATPQHAASVLSADGAAVIAGDPGTGRDISAVRALELILGDGPQPAELRYITQDWDDDETPEEEILPEPVAGRGYVFDATNRPLSLSAAQSLCSWAAKLAAVGSGLVIICGTHQWPGDARYVVPAERPDAVQVARKHLEHRLSVPERAALLADDSQRRSWSFGNGGSSAEAGAFSGLIHPNVSPDDAVAMAERLSRIPSDRLNRAMQRARGKQDPESGIQELRDIRDEIREWSGFLDDVLVEGATSGQDRVMLLAAAYLEGAPLETCIKAAFRFGGNSEPPARRYREGRSPRRRMQGVGVDVTDDDRAVFEKRPGLAMSAIRTDWRHWISERAVTRAWLVDITAPGGVAAAWARQVGERLLELSRTAAEGPFFPVMEEWAKLSDGDRIAIVAELLTKAASVPELARRAHQVLLDAAQSPVTSRRSVVAHVCQGRYRDTWPHRAFTRIRHLLKYDDEPARIAAQALVAHAGRGDRELARVVNSVDTWLNRFPKSSSSSRGFLALVDPSWPSSVFPTLMRLAQSQPQYRDFLVEGWQATLSQPEVRDQAYGVLLAWAQAAHENKADRAFTYDLLTEVRDAHTPLDAMSRFLYGNPEQEDPALVSARLALASLPGREPTRCPRPDCPLTASEREPTEQAETSQDEKSVGHREQEHG